MRYTTTSTSGRLRLAAPVVMHAMTRERDYVCAPQAMRVDVSSTSGTTVSAVQAHKSFRRVVGQSCAEFLMALLEAKGLLDQRTVPSTPPALPAASGVFLPEELFASSAARTPMLHRLLTVPGTVNYAFRTTRAAEGEAQASSVGESTSQ